MRSGIVTAATGTQRRDGDLGIGYRRVGQQPGAHAEMDGDLGIGDRRVGG